MEQRKVLGTESAPRQPRTTVDTPLHTSHEYTHVGIDTHDSPLPARVWAPRETKSLLLPGTRYLRGVRLPPLTTPCSSLSRLFEVRCVPRYTKVYLCL